MSARQHHHHPVAAAADKIRSQLNKAMLSIAFFIGRSDGELSGANARKPVDLNGLWKFLSAGSVFGLWKAAGWILPGDLVRNFALPIDSGVTFATLPSLRTLTRTERPAGTSWFSNPRLFASLFENRILMEKLQWPEPRMRSHVCVGLVHR